MLLATERGGLPVSDRGFTDKDPEDVYDATDPLDDRLHVLQHVVDHLRDNRDERFDARRLDALRLVRNLDAEDLGFLQRRRLNRIRDDLEELTDG